MFSDLERFVRAHRPCGGFEADVGEPTADGYRVKVTCARDYTFERWISPDVAADDLLRSRLLTTEN